MEYKERQSPHYEDGLANGWNKHKTLSQESTVHLSKTKSQSYLFNVVFFTYVIKLPHIHDVT